MLNDKEQQLVSAFFYNAGHANVRFMGKHVIYRDQTKGQHAVDKLMVAEDIMNVIGDQSLESMAKLSIRLIMLQVDPKKETWSFWGDWTSLPDQVFERSDWTNSPTKLLEIAKEDSVWKLN